MAREPHIEHILGRQPHLRQLIQRQEGALLAGVEGGGAKLTDEAPGDADMASGGMGGGAAFGQDLERQTDERRRRGVGIGFQRRQIPRPPVFDIEGPAVDQAIEMRTAESETFDHLAKRHRHLMPRIAAGI